MQRLCALAGVIAAVTFSSGVNAALIRMDDSPQAGKETPASATRAASRSSPQNGQAGFAPAGMQNRGVAYRGAAYSDGALVAVMPSFIDLVGGALRRDEQSFDGGAHFARRSGGEASQAGARRDAPRAVAGKMETPLAVFNAPVHSGWSNNGDWLVGQALATVPEASTSGLLLTGLGLLWLLRRRNNRLQEVEAQAAEITPADAMADTGAQPEAEGGTVVTLSGEFGGHLRLPRAQTSPPRLGGLRKQPGAPAISIRRSG